MMNAWLAPSRLRLWLARLAGGLGTAVGAFYDFGGDGNASWSALRIPVDAAALLLMGRRRWRFPAALWFGASAFVRLVSVGWMRQPEAYAISLAAALPFAVATALLVWPLLSARRESEPLAPLSGVWALVSALVVASVDAAVLAAHHPALRFGRLDDDSIFLTGFSALLLFAGMSLASHLGPLRWLAQLGVAAGLCALHTTVLRDFLELRESPNLLVARVTACLGLISFAAAMDWIRAGAAPRHRFLRAAGLALAVGLVPVALATPVQPLDAGVMLVIVLRAAAMGLAGALMPRVAGRSGVILRGRRWVGLPPGLSFALLVVGAGLAIVSLEKAKAIIPVLLFCVPLALALCFRARFARQLVFLGAVPPLLVLAAEGGRDWSHSFATPAALGAIALLGVALSGPRAGRHFTRRWRLPSASHPLPSAALAGLALLGFIGWAAVFGQQHPDTRASLLAGAAGAVPLNEPILFQPPTLRDAPAPGRHTGATVAVDPKGRGTWVVDEEMDEIALVPNDGRKPRRIKVGAWPELLVVDEDGRVFVSCRQAGEIAVVDPSSFAVTRIPVEDEVRGLALSRDERHLYAGLLLRRELLAVDTRTLQVTGRRTLVEEPRTVAALDGDIAVLPDRGSAVELVSADLRTSRSEPLPAEGRQAWHGQALVPAGRDLLVIHARVDTGLQQPISSGGGYGGSVSEPVLLVASVLQDGRAREVPFNLRRREADLGVPDVSGVAVDDGGRLYLASKTRGQVRSVALDALVRRNPESVLVAEGEGLSGVAVDGHHLRTLAAFERALITVPLKEATQAAEGPVKEDEAAPRSLAALAPGRLDAQLRLGRALFHSTGNRAIAASPNLGCVTCHTDGREDGLVWRLQGARLQTPSLTGRLHDTAPFNWHGTTASLSENIAQTVERLGGTGLEARERVALARYLREGLRPVRAPAGAAARDALVARGRKLFHDRTVGCSSCHDPASGYVDGAAHDVGSVSREEQEELAKAAGKETVVTPAFDTPSLRQVGLTAPYFHDGSAPTLEALVERNGDRMGKTSHLSPDDRRALVAYLRTL
jgi:cytochrome c peroxidase